MAELADLLVRLTLREGEDSQQITGQVSNKIVGEKIWRKVELAGTSSTKLDLFSIGTSTGPKFIFVEADQSIQLHFSNTSGQGWPIAANGFAGGWVTNTTAVWLVNDGTSLATVQVALLKVS